jgi:NADH-ubiquinone oxidoreductase chain 2
MVQWIPLRGGGKLPDSLISHTNGDDTGIPQGNLKIIDEYPIIALFSVFGINCLISSNDIISIFLSIELQSFAVYILASLYRESESATSAGLKYFLLGSLSSAILLLGVVLIYSFTGLTEFEGLYMLCSTSISNQYIHFSVLLISVGLLFKVAASPFHNWSPDVYDGVPTIVTAWLITMPKISFFIFMVNFQLILGIASQISFIFTISSLLSLVIGSLGGLIQFSIKKLLAYSSISHVGFMLLALSVNNPNSIEALLFYLFQYSLTNINVFFLLIVLGNLFSTIISIYSPFQFISQLKGLFSTNSLLGWSFAVSMFSIAGIPPIVGFFAKLEVLYSSMYNGYYFLVIVAILTSVISAVYYLSIIRVIYFDSIPSNKIYYYNRPADNLSSFIISNLTLLMSLFMLNPNFLLYSTHLLAIQLFLA